MIFEGSRYVDTYMLKDTNYEINYLKFPRIDMPITDRDIVYQYKAGDRLDILAERFYGDPQLSWKILEANPEFMNETEIKVGALITIPNPKEVEY